MKVCVVSGPETVPLSPLSLCRKDDCDWQGLFVSIASRLRLHPNVSFLQVTKLIETNPEDVANGVSNLSLGSGAAPATA